jgi:hypothetical protein
MAAVPNPITKAYVLEIYNDALEACKKGPARPKRGEDWARERELETYKKMLDNIPDPLPNDATAAVYIQQLQDMHYSHTAVVMRLCVKMQLYPTVTVFIMFFINGTHHTRVKFSFCFSHQHTWSLHFFGVTIKI